MNRAGTEAAAGVSNPTRGLAVVATARLALLTGLLSLAACGTSKPPVVDFSAAPEDYRSEDYPSVYWRWTRHEKVTANLESALEVWATYKSRDYREAFVAHYAEAYSLGDTAREQLRQSEHEAAANGYEFVVTTQSANYKWNDLDKKSSPWRVTLLDGAGREISPDEFRVEKFPDMFEREFYPVKTPFSKTSGCAFCARRARTRASPASAPAASCCASRARSGTPIWSGRRAES